MPEHRRLELWFGAIHITHLPSLEREHHDEGPKLGEQGHFRRALEAENNGDLSYAIRRFDNEAHRIYGVMNLGLFNKRYLAAGEYTIADMICYPWASSWATREIDIDEFPNVKRWLEEIGERPAVKKAMAMGPEFREDPASISPEEQARRRRLSWPVWDHRELHCAGRDRNRANHGEVIPGNDRPKAPERNLRQISRVMGDGGLRCAVMRVPAISRWCRASYRAHRDDLARSLLLHDRGDRIAAIGRSRTGSSR